MRKPSATAPLARGKHSAFIGFEFKGILSFCIVNAVEYFSHSLIPILASRSD
jgi:hypothetical protein